MRVKNCRLCGAPITFIRTRKGKAMPCNAYALPYQADPDGPENIMTAQGDLVRGRWINEGKSDGVGYKPHWADCQK